MISIDVVGHVFCSDISDCQSSEGRNSEKSSSETKTKSCLEVQISMNSMSRIVREIRMLRGLQICNKHLLMNALKKCWREKPKHLLSEYSHDRHRKIIFVDERRFTME